MRENLFISAAFLSPYIIAPFILIGIVTAAKPLSLPFFLMTASAALISYSLCPFILYKSPIGQKKKTFAFTMSLALIPVTLVPLLLFFPLMVAF
jgi:hypothetical protein